MKKIKSTRLILMWNHPETKANYKIGLLDKLEDGYSFQYLQEDVDVACRAGFSILTGFPELDRTYVSPTLFAVFERRIPGKSRKDFRDVVERFGLSGAEDVQYEVLRVTQGILATDRLSFVEPILLIDGAFEVEFYVAAWGRYNAGLLTDSIALGQPMRLACDNENKEPFAVKICTSGPEVLLAGYVPRPYNVRLFEWLQHNLHYTAEVISLTDAKQAYRPVLAVHGEVPRDEHGRYLLPDQDPILFEADL